MTLPLAVPALAAGLWQSLQAALDECDPPCRADPNLWTGPARHHEQAVAACWRCPALGPCRSYALAAGEPEFVWGALTPAERCA